MTDSSTDDYYSYAPRVRLERPVALVGFPGAEAAQTARVATMLTGLGVVLLPHQVTHRVGTHHEGLLLAGRHDEVHAAERELLERAGRMRSPPVIALGPTTLDDDICRDWVRRSCRLVHLRQTLPEAVARISAQRKDDSRKHAHLVGRGVTEEGLASLFALRTGLYERLAQDEIAVGNRTPLDLGRALIAQLGW